MARRPHPPNRSLLRGREEPDRPKRHAATRAVAETVVLLELEIRTGSEAMVARSNRALQATVGTLLSARKRSKNAPDPIC